MSKIKNFRHYILEKISQTNVDRKDTFNDTKAGKKKGLDEYQHGSFDGRKSALNEIYNDCKKYEWIKRT